MIEEKRLNRGQLPLDADTLEIEELRPVLVKLQAQRVELLGLLDDARENRDRLALMKPATEQAARERHLEGRDKKPAETQIRASVLADPEVAALLTEIKDLARALARLDDELGAVRSGIRIVDRLIETADGAEAKDW